MKPSNFELSYGKNYPQQPGERTLARLPQRMNYVDPDIANQQFIIEKMVFLFISRLLIFC